eukprot:2354646-Pyramimonas_sp.AAC.1
MALMPMIALIHNMPAALPEHCTPPHLLATLVDRHRRTHFRAASGTQRARSGRGKRSGSSWADAVDGHFLLLGRGRRCTR